MRSRATEKYRRVGFFKIKLTLARELTTRCPWEFNASRMGANPIGLLSRRGGVLSMSIHIYRRCDVQWRAERTGTIIQCGSILIKRCFVSRKNISPEKISSGIGVALNRGSVLKEFLTELKFLRRLLSLMLNQFY